MSFKSEKIKNFNLMLNSLCIFKNFIKDNVMKSYENLINYLNKNEFDINVFLKLYNTFTYNLMEETNEFSIREYIINKIFNSEYEFKNLLNKDELNNEIIVKQMKYELDLLEKLSEIQSEDVKKCVLKKGILSEFEIYIIDNLIQWNKDFKLKNEYIDDCENLKSKLFQTNEWGNFLDKIIIYYN